MAHLTRGQPQEALPHLEYAVSARPGHAPYMCTLGEARRRLGNHAGAIALFEQALRLQPAYAVARYNLGCALLGDGEPRKAAAEFERLLAVEPGNARYLLAFADALREGGRFARALRYYRRALEGDPDSAAANSNLGALLLHMGRAQEAIELCRRGVELAPDDFRTHFNLGRCLVETEQLDEAMSAYARAHELSPESVELNVSIGDVWRGVGEPAEAAFWYAKALQLDPAAPRARAGQAMLRLDAGDTEGAVATLRELAGAQPYNVRLLLDLSQAQWEDGSSEDAIVTLESALEYQPESANLHARIGAILASAGKVDEAVRRHRTALDHDPNSVAALSGLAVTQRGKMEPELVERMRGLLSSPRLRDGARASLHSGLAAWHDARRESADAITHGREANRCQWAFRTRRGWEYDPAEYAREIQDLIDAYTPERFAQLAEFGLPDVTPVFIVGMPRSGTTLTEQILASHPQVLGIGERGFAAQAFQRLRQLTNQAAASAVLDQARPEHVRQIARRYLEQLEALKRKLGKPEARYVVDKMPENYAHAGWIRVLFPNARIVYARRDLRDVALSCWLTQFGQIRWACDMGHISERIREHLKVMGHWRRVLPGGLLENDYESLVADQEPQTRRLLEWLDLPWNPACLQFHKTERIVRTASVSQVRNPMYRSSVARWKPYAGELAPVIEVLRQAGLTPIGEDSAAG